MLADIIAKHPATTVQQRALCGSLAWQLVDREKIEKRFGPTDDPLQKGKGFRLFPPPAPGYICARVGELRQLGRVSFVERTSTWLVVTI